MPYIPNPTFLGEQVRGCRPAPEQLAVPLVHMNGTGKTGLIEPLQKAYERCEDLIKALGEVTPHNRDYYPVDDSTIAGTLYRIARDQHEDRISRVMNLQHELASIAMAIQNQGK